jgi:nucleoid-associated protein YgaU
MNAEAEACSVASFDPNGGITAAPAGSGAPGSRGARRPPRAANRRAPVVRPEVDDVSWNVLAEHLVPFPRPASQALWAREPAGARRDDRKDAERSRGYGEAWLERELIAIRYRADAGYPALGGRLLGAGQPPAKAPAATARAATARIAAARAAATVTDAAQATAGASAPAASRAEITDPERGARRLRKAAAQTRTGAAIEPRWLRRLLPGAATIVALSGLWAGAAMLATAQRPSLAVLPGSVKTPAGYVYVVRPGDTLWSIAARLQPGGDPRVLVTELERQVPGATLVPGSRLVLP